MAPIAYVLNVVDHVGHNVGQSRSAIDKKHRVSWAWNAAKERNDNIGLLHVDVEAGTINGSDGGHHGKLLRQSFIAANRILPLLAKSWDSSAPSSIRCNVAKKLGFYERLRQEGVGQTIDEKGRVQTFEQFCSLYMKSYSGATRAVRGMIVAAIFAVDLSKLELIPVVVLGRPPGHHATCEHVIRFGTPLAKSPGGKLSCYSMHGGCFYPSCWVAAVHSLREGSASRIAYVDVDAHKPDGVWREIDHLRCLRKDHRATLLGDPARCECMLFASIHVDGYPRPDVNWNSVNCVIPRSCKSAFEVQVLEELLPDGMGQDGLTTQAEFLKSFTKWKNELLQKMKIFKPNGIFVGLGFDLHMSEAKICHQKRVGVGMKGATYCELFTSLFDSLQSGPVVLTLEGGYTEDGVRDGMHGVLDGLKAFSSRSTRHDALHMMPTEAASALKKRPSSAENIAEKVKLAKTRRVSL